jgi:hypothetical protein
METVTSINNSSIPAGAVIFEEQPVQQSAALLFTERRWNGLVTVIIPVTHG